jgi:hypothetical protein
VCGRRVDLGGSYIGPWPPVGPGLTAHSQPVWAHPWPVRGPFSPCVCLLPTWSFQPASCGRKWPYFGPSGARFRSICPLLSVPPPSTDLPFSTTRFRDVVRRIRGGVRHSHGFPLWPNSCVSPKSRLWEASLSDLADFVVALPCPSDERRAVFRWSANVTWSASQTQGHQPISADRLRAGGRPAEPLFLHRNARANCCFRPAPPRLPWSRPDIADRLRAWRTPCRTAVFGQNARANRCFPPAPPRLPWSRPDIRRPTSRVADALPNRCYWPKRAREPLFSPSRRRRVSRGAGTKSADRLRAWRTPCRVRTHVF